MEVYKDNLKGYEYPIQKNLPSKEYLQVQLLLPTNDEYFNYL